ncbi:MAG: tol-pal system protein YbgF [Candidatus Methylomirabilales bacterium]
MGEMMARHPTWPLLVGVALLSNACVVTAEQFQSLQQDVRGLRGELNTLAKNRVVSEERLEQIEAQLRGVEAGAPPSTNLVARLEELGVEIRMVQGKLEENSHRLSELNQRLDETEIKVARLLATEGRGSRETPPAGQPAIPSATPPPPAPGGGVPQSPPPEEAAQPDLPTSPPPVTGQPLPPPGGGPSPPQPPVVATPRPPVVQGSLPSPEEVYRTGLSDYTKGNYDLAISSFKTYLTFFPKTSLVPNAQYWLAESYYSKREYLQAIREFDKVVKEYPDSTKVPSAMLKQGYAYLELGETAQGRRALRGLIAKFPRSREARLAQDRLERLE